MQFVLFDIVSGYSIRNSIDPLEILPNSMAFIVNLPAIVFSCQRDGQVSLMDNLDLSLIFTTSSAFAFFTSIVRIA